MLGMSADLKNSVKIKVFGVGGGGCNAINRLVAANVQGVEFIASNTDLAVLELTKVEKKIQLGAKLTGGHGAGGKPEKAEQAAEESADEIRAALEGAQLVFVTAGMGGGTGTGAAPVVARIAKELNILTVAVVTKPFEIEGKFRMALAEAGIANLAKYSDVVVVVPNEKAFASESRDITLLQAYQKSDAVLHNCIIGITDIIVKPALINVDFADLETVIKGKGTAHIGIGRAKGEDRILTAVKQAASSPLLDTSIAGATEIIVSITGDINMSGKKVNEALSQIAMVVDPNANIIHGISFDDTLKEEAHVTIIATGFESEQKEDTQHAEQEMPASGYGIADASFGVNGNGYSANNFGTRQPQNPAPAAPAAQKPQQSAEDGEIPNFLLKLKNRGRK